MRFLEWAGDSAKKAYLLEPLPDMAEMVRDRFSDDSRISIYNCAAWNKKEMLYFQIDAGGTCQNSCGQLEVEGATIDSIVGDAPITFIKMDIEGSEKNALIGAKNTILMNHPRLAICIYHKPNDIVDIGNYLAEIVPEYKFYIRHYTSCMEETVLYAAI